MNTINDQAISEGYRERIRRLALFDSLYRLEKKTAKDLENRPIDYFGLGVLSLLFFFENMLMRNNQVSVMNLADFLSRRTEGVYDLGAAEIEKVAKSIVEEFRPPGGRKNSRTFFNWETGKEDQVTYAILKASGYDPVVSTQYYILDDDGLELVFATREFYAEFSLSINQLLLRKQLEKGEFASALRQIDEMRMDVIALKDRIVKISHDIQRSIVSDETYNRFRDVIEDLNSRMGRENEEFKELQSFVADTKNRLQYDLNGEKERRAYELILEINLRLSEVHYEHSNLFQEGIVLKTTALRAAQQSLYHVGLNAFNFKEQLTGRLLSEPLPLCASRQLANPFLYLEQARTWSPLTVFGKQRVERNDGDVETKGFSAIDTDIQQTSYRHMMAVNYHTIMTLLLKMLDQNQFMIENGVVAVELSQFVSWLKSSEECPLGILNDRAFYEFWLLVHQRSPIHVAKNGADSGQDEDDGSGIVLEKAISRLSGKYTGMRVEAGLGILEPAAGFSIKNLVITLQQKENGNEPIQ